jgi:FHA domain
MNVAGDQTTCHLRIEAPAALRGSILRVNSGRSVVGRAPRSQVLIDSPDVSRTHAAIDHRPGTTTIEDLGSTHGTVLNGVPVHRPRPVRHGDQICFGSVVAVFEDRDTAGPPTQASYLPPVPPAPQMPPSPWAPPAPPPTPVRYDIGDQQAGIINNVARDQYVYQRESFLREVAASKTRARRLIAVGALLFVGGFVAMAAVLYQFGVDFSEVMQSDLNASQQPDVPELAFPVAVLATLVSGLGVFLMILGVVLHVMATARRRRVEPAYPHPPRSGR